MYCRKCGKMIQDNAKFCGYCGAEITKLNPCGNQKNMHIEIQKKRQKRIPFAVIIPVITVCVLIGIFIYPVIGNPKGWNTSIVYLTSGYELNWMEDKNRSNETSLASFNSVDIDILACYDEEAAVFYSNDGDVLYYFDVSKGYHDDAAASLYSLRMDELEKGHPVPVLVDEAVIMNSGEKSYLMETLDNGGLIYVAEDFADQELVLKYYNGETSSELVGGDEIKAVFNEDKTMANICVSSYDTFICTWYRLVIDDYPSVEYVCDGTMSSFSNMEYTTAYEWDFQTMAENDVILCVSDCKDEYGYYYSVDLYVHGQWSENVIEMLPRDSIGPMGVNVDEEAISFYMIAAVDGMETASQYYEGDSEQWSFYHYENGLLTEVSEELRIQGDPYNTVELWSICYINNELLIRDKDEWARGEWVSVKELGNSFEITEFGEESNGFYYPYIAANDEGERILLLRNDNDDALYAYADGVLKKIAENVRDIDIYEKPDERLLIVLGDEKLYSVKLNDVSINSIEENCLAYDIREDIIRVIPYYDNRFLCVSYDGFYRLLYWNGKKYESICNIEYDYVWSGYRRKEIY